MSEKLDALKKKVLEATTDSDIASLYLLEAQAHEVFDEETLHGYYTNILDIALQRLTDTLEKHKRMDFSEVQDFATLRALYEYAMEHYHAKKLLDASALFEVLAGLSNSKKFSDALKIHWFASRDGISLDDFLSDFADVQKTQKNGTFYISAFQSKADEILKSEDR